jgi:hypothetical protein
MAFSPSFDLTSPTNSLSPTVMLSLHFASRLFELFFQISSTLIIFNQLNWSDKTSGHEKVRYCLWLAPDMDELKKIFSEFHIAFESILRVEETVPDMINGKDNMRSKWKRKRERTQSLNFRWQGRDGCRQCPPKRGLSYANCTIIVTK